ncbi:4'-phosphopantetheinyl transferase superfamily protein [Dyadobacter sp. CY326]|uniref:4'-phosphopantetheinyl transferase family protein n=1 Tax=Dyadobacter sp. CY326 TaxID=2907300 RepID=UPI001F1F50A0|nr:4'-phosphopantetheinyl transferase superfamily protein [Dyadobacter sp. CY326]MCE7064147.1 4'-phosphopantetheinyl transferase superfamily protein [Dyadobacter sp. CY326]
MGISYIKSISQHASLGLWHITESWPTLKDMADLPESALHPLDDKRNDKRKQEWLACRVLLKEMLPAAALIAYDTNRKPHIEGDKHQISMSHSGDYVSVYIHDSEPVGVDLQLMKPSISKGSDYFLNALEQQWVNVDNNLLLHLIWCAKEAVFKYAGDADLDLKKHIITNPFASNQNGKIQVSILKENTRNSVMVQFETFNNYVLAWTI